MPNKKGIDALTLTQYRIAIVLTSLLFIPAFMMGVATIWIFIGAFSVSLLFHKQLLRILERNPYTEHKKKNSLCLLKHYFLTVLEICALSTLPILLFMNIGEPDIDIKISGLDDLYISALDFKWFFLKDFVDEYYQVRVFILYFSSALLSMFITAALSWNKLSDFCSEFLYLRDTTIENEKRKVNSVVTAFYKGYSTVSFVMIFFSFFFYGTLLRRAFLYFESSVFIVSLFTFLSCTISYFVLFLYFSSNKATSRLLKT